MCFDISQKHTFVVCAYRESPYLEECISSLLKQKCKSTIIISTGTPNLYIEKIAKKYNLKLYINKGSSSLANDWNFALSCAQTELVTLAHQDDIYESDYSSSIWKAYLNSKMPIILFTDYSELRNGITVKKNTLLTIKRTLLLPLRFPCFWNNKFIRRRILSLGSAICCPAVTLVKNNVSMPLFENNMKSNIDWQAWELLSRRTGAFVYIPQAHMQHRIHQESTTSELLENSERREEDLMVFRKFWPEPIAQMIEKIYQKGEKSNSLSK